MRSLLLALAACGPDPFRNDPPVLHTVNGVEQTFASEVVTGAEDGRAFVLDEVAVPGEPFALRLEVSDPEGDAVSVWFPLAPPGIAFEPDETSGVWEVPPDPAADPTTLVIVLEDDHPEIRRAASFAVQVPVQRRGSAR